MAAKNSTSLKLRKGQDTPRKGRADVYIINFVYSLTIILSYVSHSAFNNFTSEFHSSGGMEPKFNGKGEGGGGCNWDINPL